MKNKIQKLEEIVTIQEKEIDILKQKSTAQQLQMLQYEKKLNILLEYIKDAQKDNIKSLADEKRPPHY